MEHSHWGVLKIKGVDPETFWIFFVDLQLPKGGFMETSGNFTESELRTELGKMGCNEVEIDSLVKRAREGPI